MLVSPFAGLFNSVSGYAITSAALFDGSTGYLSRTPSSAGDSTTDATVNFWVDISRIGVDEVFFDVNQQWAVRHSQAGSQYKLQMYHQPSASAYYWWSSADFRDTNWINVHIIEDTSNATGDDRYRIYVNGERLPNDGAYSDVVPLNSAIILNSTATHRIGSRISASYFGGRIAEFRCLDGIIAEPTNFGEFNNGQWEPIKYSGTYGTNGFYLKFEDGALGTDSSGNGNDWTVNGTVTAVTNTPTAVEATLNPLDSQTGVFSNGNLSFARDGSGDDAALTTLSIPTSGEYWCTVAVTAATVGLGVISGGLKNRGTVSLVSNATDSCVYYGGNGNKYVDGSGSTYGSTFTSSDVIGIHRDVDSGEVTFYKQTGGVGSFVSQGTITYTKPSGPEFFYIIVAAGTSAHTFNFTDLSDAPNANCKALIVENLDNASFTSGTVSVIGALQYTGGVPSSISGVTVDEIFATGFTSTNTGAWTCTVSNPIGGTVMPRGQAN